MNKNFKRIVGVIGIAILCSATAFAGTSYSRQEVRVPSVGGAGYSKNEIKSITGKSGNIMNPTVGGGYTVSARMVCNGSIGSSRSVSTQTGTLDVSSTNSQKKGSNANLVFTSKLSTPVKVSVTGQMRTN